MWVIKVNWLIEGELSTIIWFFCKHECIYMLRRDTFYFFKLMNWKRYSESYFLDIFWYVRRRVDILPSLS